MICDMQRRGGKREDDEEEEEEARGTEAQCPAEVICLGSYRAYSHCWQSHMQTDTGGKEKMWEQHEKPAESQVLWLYLVASEEIRKSETERRLGVEKGLTNTQTKVAERVCTAICTHTHRVIIQCIGGKLFSWECSSFEHT